MTGRSPDVAALVFARAPLPGATKTRLIPLLGAEGAAALHRRLVRQALATAAAAGAAELWCTPDCSDPFLQAAATDCDASLHAQRGTDLGTRMADALADALRRKPYAVCIGSDCPALTAQHLQQAVAALRAGHEAVLAPAEDGGYALIGLARQAPGLFAGIDWGGPAVMAQTREQLRAGGLHWLELETLWDVDRPEDYRRLQQSGLLDTLPPA
jgi:rSAM/selenodomain-associated transferase 1